jgi:hypothetical protein
VLPGFDNAVKEWLEGQVHYFQLVDATGTPIAGYSPIADGAMIPLSTLGAANVQAVTYPSSIGSVGFVLDGKKAALDNSAPYVLPTSTLTTGPHTLTAIPWYGANAGGEGGSALTLTFTIK